jgi:hypothetical protein
MPQIANMARTRITKNEKKPLHHHHHPTPKGHKNKDIVEGLARQKLLGAKTRKGAYGNLSTKIVIKREENKCIRG